MEAILWHEVALTLLKNLGSSSRSTRDRGGEPANHSEATTFGPSPGKFKPRKFAKTDVVATSGNPNDLEGGNGTPSDVMSVLLASDIEDSDENEDSDFFIEAEESGDYSSDSDSDLGDRDQPSQQRS
ncbi:hypothetical protein E2C01_090354 [Portunus trituberculatus]|uniref:Uncharacterized protein n=1 Tax=Portunus trituberculatus TaxID=210409 RepID=A0A5B7JPW0_PORTR|nr:hypothetical protein [Portunus trituberculatus]